MEGGGVLPGVQVHQAQVVRDDPLEGAQVQRLLEAGDGRDVALGGEGSGGPSQTNTSSAM